MNKIFFVAGASGSGKSAIMSDLKVLLGNSVSVYDFDDIGVPEGADKRWRQESTEVWLKKILSDGKDACLLGQIVLGEILACPSAKFLSKVNFCLLDLSDFERIVRLRRRNTYGADQNMLNWASWLRMHHVDPQWTRHAVMEGSWPSLNFDSWNGLSSWEELAEVETIDTTNLTVLEVAKAVAEWIKKKTNFLS